MKIKLKLCIFLLLFFILIYSLASSADKIYSNQGLENYLDHIGEKKIDIVFVFDTSNSMNNEIQEMRSISNNLTNELMTSGLDYELGLVSFRDFPLECNNRMISCGDPGDFPYKVYGNGRVSGDAAEFNSWLNDLRAEGGADEPESILAAIRHALVDQDWRDDADKIIILMTAAYPHPDGDCCNVEGDTLGSTLSSLGSRGIKVETIGPEKESIRTISEQTGGRFYQIRSGLTLEHIMQDILQGTKYSFKIESRPVCENNKIEINANLVGRGKPIPYVPDQTAVWVFVGEMGKNSSKYDLMYDKVAGAYHVDIEDMCGPVNLTFYGRVGNWSSTKTEMVTCRSCSMQSGGGDYSGTIPKAFAINSSVGGNYSGIIPKAFAINSSVGGNNSGTVRESVTAEQISIQGIGPEINANLTSTQVGSMFEIQGYVFEDLNHNGLRDPEEPGLSGRPISLIGADGYNVTTSTDATGFYKFTSIKEGAYQVVYHPVRRTVLVTLNVNMPGCVKGSASGSYTTPGSVTISNNMASNNTSLQDSSQ